MHFAEIAPNSVAYTFREDIIQPNNEVIEFTKVNRVFLGLIRMRRHPKMPYLDRQRVTISKKIKFTNENYSITIYLFTIFLPLFINIKLLKAGVCWRPCNPSK